MPGCPPEEVSRLLRAWCQGDDEALEKLMPPVYDELHRRAHRHMARAHPDRTLKTTALVNEAYIRLVDTTMEPLFDPVRSHPRYLALLDQMRIHI